MERPILFSGEMVRAILEGRKSQTRRVIKDVLTYSLTDDMLYGNLNKEVYYGDRIEGDTDLTEQRLYGWIRRTNLFTDEIQRLWEKGVRGLVSIKRTRFKQGLPNDISLSQREESDEDSPPLGLYGISRDAAKKIIAGETFRWNPSEYNTIKPQMGNAGRELVRQKSSWARERRGKTSNGEIDKRRVLPLKVGNQDWTVQQASCRPCSWDVPGWCVSYSPWQKGLYIWVRETWRIGAWHEDGMIAVDYKADNYARREWLTVPDGDMFERYFIQCGDDCEKAGLELDENERYSFPVGEAVTRWRPPRFMPKFVSRLTLKITDIRIEVLQEISEEDITAEGVDPCVIPMQMSDFVSYEVGFQQLWDSINGKKPGRSWDDNPWVWVIEFERTEAT